jgi:stage II sporulation protein AA (anti-sigma F factor antagonist)
MAEQQITDSGRPDRLSAVTTTIDGIRVVTLAGEIDYHTGSRFEQALEITGAALPRVVIDMGQVTFMDSVGINILIGAHQDAAAAGGWIRLAAPTGPVLRVMQLVGVDSLIDCQPTLRQALTL